MDKIANDQFTNNQILSASAETPPDIAVGAIGNVVLSPNKNIANDNNGEIRAVGSILSLASGVDITLSSSLSEVNTPYEGSYGTSKFYLIAGTTPTSVRFPGQPFGNTGYLFAAEYDSVAATWTAISNSGVATVFVPEATDCIIASGMKYQQNQGIEEFTSFVSYLGSSAHLFENEPKSNLEWVPPSTIVSTSGPTSIPSSPPYFNVLIGHDVTAPAAGDAVFRSTIIGSLAGTSLERSERSEAIGQGAMRFSKYANRCTAIGSLAQQWIGQDVSKLEESFHDFFIFDSGSGIRHPGQSGWNAYGLEAANPGVGTKISAVTSAASADEVRENVGVGRNTLLHLIKGSQNTALGYNALAHAYNSANNVAVGRGSLANCVLGNQNVGVGQASGAGHQEGSGNIYVGYSSGIDHVSGDRVVMIGREAGLGWSGMDRSILIGADAGKNQPVRSDVLLIQNDEGREPLVSGQFDTGRVGINIAENEIFASALHIRSGISGATNANVSGDDLVVEGNGNTGITICCPNDRYGELNFADPDDNNIGSIWYNHATDEMSFRSGNTTNIRQTASGLGFFGNTPASKPVVTGSRAGNAALTSLLSALAQMGLITNNSTT